MAISNFLNEQRLQKFLGPQFINEGIPSVYRPANVSPFFGMDATSGATPRLGLEPLYPNFGAPMPMDNSPRFLLQPDINTNAPMLAPLDMNRFQGVSDMSIIDETTNDEQDQQYIDQVDQSNNKFGGIMDLIGSIAIPGYGFFKNIARGGLEGLKGFGRKLGQSDFAQSSNHMEFLDRIRNRNTRTNDISAADIQNEMANRSSAIQTNQDRGRGDRPGGANYSAPSRPSKASSYRDSSSFGKSFHG